MSTQLKDLISWHSLQESTTLFEASAFRITIRIFAVLGLTYFASMVLSGSFIVSVSPNSHPAEILFETLKRPVIIFGLSLPIIALIANHHRSIQSERQLRTNQEQNIFTNYVKHIEKFEEFRRSRKLFEHLIIFEVFPNDLYHSIYSRAAQGGLKPSFEFTNRVKSVKNRVNTIQRKLAKMDRTARQQSPESLKLLDTALAILKSNFCFSVVEKRVDVTNSLSFGPVLLEASDLCKDIEKCTSFIFPSECQRDLDTIAESLERMASSLYRSARD